MRIFLIGARASGKTTLAQRLASHFGCPHVDTDAMILEAAGKCVADIVAEEGWAGFRKRECAALRQASRPTDQVVATGGGIVLDPSNRLHMKENGVVIYLKAPAETLAGRLALDPMAGQRPSLTGSSIVDEVTAILEEREPLYHQTAHHVVDATAAPDMVLASIINLVQRRAGE